MKTTQSDAILSHLRTGKTITPLEALELYGCFRLGARIHDLKKRGIAVTSRLRQVRPDGPRVAHYQMEVAP